MNSKKTQTLRACDVKAAGEKLYSTKLKQLEFKFKELKERVEKLEKGLQLNPIDEVVAESGNLLKKGK